MSDTDQILDQAQAELRAGRKAEAWKLTAPIVKADPNNARAWRILADISDNDAPERAGGYRAKAEAAEAAARFTPAPMRPPVQPAAPPQPPLQQLRSTPQPSTVPVKKRRPVAAILIALGLVALLGAGGWYALDSGMFVASPAEQTATAERRCADASTAYRDEIQPLAQEWEDAVKLAGQTSRMALPGQVSAMQAIRRKADAMAPPACLEKTHGHLIASMDASIDGFLSFMSQDGDFIVSTHFKTATSEYDAFTRGILAATP